jgi:Tfp pilus assembly protein PilN
VLLSGVDTHSRTYLEYRDVVDDLADHLGSAPTVVQRAIIEEAAGLVVWCRKARLALLKGDEFNISAYTTATNTLRRLLADIGQEALLKDVTPDLDTYLASKRETKRLAAEAAQQFEDDGDGVVVETAQPSDANGHDEAAA